MISNWRTIPEKEDKDESTWCSDRLAQSQRQAGIRRRHIFTELPLLLAILCRISFPLPRKAHSLKIIFDPVRILLDSTLYAKVCDRVQWPSHYK